MPPDSNPFHIVSLIKIFFWPQKYQDITNPMANRPVLVSDPKLPTKGNFTPCLGKLQIVFL